MISAEPECVLHLVKVALREVQNDFQFVVGTFNNVGSGLLQHCNVGLCLVWS